ncbi:DoxX family protein [Actinomadura sp. HBU206391]|uniref:DoxX family protein n=1 Tax=Actinomadura sp. HBU206391 TaxID=2731692 RepID=UPI00164F5746|nr:DoxX family protein [Actinomadura sp. HBU206391]MBC6461500.1 DoxX family protein [Actinomadura sp. HBU206391]
MFIAYAVIAVLLAALLAMSARAKLTKEEKVTKTITGLGVPLGWFPFLAACELAGAVGLVIGLWFAPLGIAAAVGVVLYFVGAVGAHLRAGDMKGAPTPLVVLILSVAALVLRITSS